MEPLLARPAPAAASRQSSRPMTPRAPVPKRPSPLSHEYVYDTFDAPPPIKRRPLLSKRVIIITVAVAAALIASVVIGVVLRNAANSAASADANLPATTASSSVASSHVPKFITLTTSSTASDPVDTAAAAATTSIAQAAPDMESSSTQIMATTNPTSFVAQMSDASTTTAVLVNVATTSALAVATTSSVAAGLTTSDLGLLSSSSAATISVDVSTSPNILTTETTAAVVTSTVQATGQSTSSVLLTSTGVRATWWASTSDSGGCQLPSTTYSSSLTGAIALGDISTLGQLSYTAAYCGQVFQIDCGSGPVNAVVASTCNIGQGNCGIDMITSTWNAATANAAFGVASCSVSLTSMNVLPGASTACYYQPTSDFANAYFKLLGVLNTGGRLVASATLDGISGSVSSGDWYQFQAGTSPFTNSSALVFNYSDGSSTAFSLSACVQPSGVQIFS
ncbi:hypothetical protein HDU83_006835 [Entophlyctis luteolus]|nr:hypothetical protein HDU83_006835 [Entophlyctis luteolus]